MSSETKAMRGVAPHKRIHTAAGVGTRHPNFKNHGGPVISAPRITTSFWGAGWSTPPNRARADRLNQFMRDFLASKYMNILTQYGVGHGAFAGETSVAAVAAEISDKDIHTIIQKAIDDGTIMEPGPNDCLVIFLDDGIGVKDADTTMCEPTSDDAFGYHFFFKTSKGHDFFYAVIPSLNDACIHNTCPDPTQCSLQVGQTREQRQTQVTTHEVSEMLTDPKLTAWFDDDGGSENGDICNGEPGQITVGANTWTVQKMYSKVDDVKTKGQTICVVAPKKPLPAAH